MIVKLSIVSLQFLYFSCKCASYLVCNNLLRCRVLVKFCRECLLKPCNILLEVSQTFIQACHIQPSAVQLRIHSSQRGGGCFNAGMRFTFVIQGIQNLTNTHESWEFFLYVFVQLCIATLPFVVFFFGIQKNSPEL